LGALRRSYAGRGSKPHRPDLLLRLVLFEHERGRPQPVQWSKDLHENKAVQWLTLGIRPSLTTPYEFRDRAQPLLEGLNRQVIRAAIAEGHTDGSCGALDGTTVAANATRHRLVNPEAVERRLEALDREIAAAERSGSAAAEGPGPGAVAAPPPAAPPVAPPTPDPDSATVTSPGPAAAPPRTARTLRGKRRQRENCRRAREVLRAKLAADARRRKDKRKGPRKIRVALGDPAAPFGLDKLKTYRPLYNVQTMSDVQTDLVLAYATTATTADSGLLPPMVERTAAMTGRPLKEALVDSGYPSGEDLAWCESRGVTVYAPWNENAFTEGKRAAKGGPAQIPKDRFTFDPEARAYRCPEGKTLRYRERSRQQRADGDYFTIEIYRADPSDCSGCPLKGRCVRGGSGARTVRRGEHEELVEGLKGRMKQPEAKEKYRRRGCTVERRFADAKTHRGLQRFSGRTRERADAQVGLTVLAHNLTTLEKLRTKREEQRMAGEMAQ
jgi:transposase